MFLSSQRRSTQLRAQRILESNTVLISHADFTDDADLFERFYFIRGLSCWKLLDIRNIFLTQRPRRVFEY